MSKDKLNGDQINKSYDEIVNDLTNEWGIEKLVEFDEFNIREKITNNPYQTMRFETQKNKEKNNLEKLIELKDKIIGEVYHKYRFEYDESLQKSEIEKYYIPRDEKVLRINKYIRAQKARLDFFDTCVTALKQQHWGMKNFIETRKGEII